MLNTVKVHEVKERPAKLDGYIMISRGIRTKEAAEKWAVHYGFTTVYWIRSEEKVYGVKSIANDAEALEQNNTMLSAVSEQGQGLIEVLFLVAVVVFVLIYACPKSWKW